MRDNDYHPNRIQNLTVVLPSLNSIDTIPATIHSLKCFKENGARIIVADSFSTDGTYELAIDFATKTLQVPAGNMYAAINAAINTADTEWITYINTDDLLYYDSVKDAMALAPDGTDLIYGKVDFIDIHGRFLHCWKPAHPSLLQRIQDFTNPVPQQGTIFTRRLFDRLGGFDVSFTLAADYDFFVRALNLDSTTFFRHSGVMAAYRQHKNRLAKKNINAMALEAKRVRQKNKIPQQRLPALRRLLILSFPNILSYALRILRRFQMSEQLTISKSTDG